MTSCKPVSFSRRTLHHGASNSKFSRTIIYGVLVIYVLCTETLSLHIWDSPKCLLSHRPVHIASVRWHEYAGAGNPFSLPPNLEFFPQLSTGYLLISLFLIGPKG